VQEYNVSVRTFPNNLTAMVMGWQTKANFTVEDEKAISAPPAIKFDAPPAVAPAPTAAPAPAPAAAPASPTSAGYQ
jgi:LemA protein